MQIKYGHPASGGPSRFLMYDSEEVLQHLVSSANEQKKQQKSVVDASKYQISVIVDGIMSAVVFTAALIRENNIPLVNTYYNKDKRELVIGYDDIKYKQALITYATELLAGDSLFDLKVDKWGNNLFTNGKSVV